jgi:hypothetical protein
LRVTQKMVKEVARRLKDASMDRAAGATYWRGVYVPFPEAGEGMRIRFGRETTRPVGLVRDTFKLAGVGDLVAPEVPSNQYLYRLIEDALRGVVRSDVTFLLGQAPTLAAAEEIARAAREARNAAGVA